MNFAKEIDNMQPKEFQVFKNELPSNMWYSRFMQRNQLSLRQPENISVARIDMSTEEVRDELFEKYVALLKKYGFCSDEIYNMDETGLQLVSKSPKIVCSRGSKRVVVRKSGERSETISIAACANASGNVILPPFIIFRGESLSEDVIEGKHRLYIIFTY